MTSDHSDEPTVTNILTPALATTSKPMCGPRFLAVIVMQIVIGSYNSMNSETTVEFGS